MEELPTDSAPPTEAAPVLSANRSSWGRFSSIVLRFFFVYWLLYTLPLILMFPGQLLYLGLSQLSGPTTLSKPWVTEVTKYLNYPGSWFQLAMDRFTPWVTEALLGVHVEPLTDFTGSGDRQFNYCTCFAYLVLTIVTLVAWTLGSELWRRFRTRRPPDYDLLYALMRLIVRFHLMYQMLIYGAMKVWCAQFPPIIDFQLETKYGDSSPMGLLWRFMQFSQPYTSATGIVEFICGLLLISRRTAVLGAMCSLAASLQVFLLNMCYDVPVKLMSGHLVLMSLTLLVPETKRLFPLFVLGKPARAMTLTPIFGHWKWLEWSAIGLRTGVFLAFAALTLLQEYKSATTRGILVPENPIHGRWIVKEFVRDGEKVAIPEQPANPPPQPITPSKWQGGPGMPPVIRVAIAPTNVIFMFEGGSGVNYRNADPNGSGLALANMKDGHTVGELQVSLPEPDSMVLEGALDGQQVRLKLTKVVVVKKDYLLRSRGFQWIQDRPFNR